MKARRLLSWLLCAAMLVALVPAGVLSASGEGSTWMNQVNRYGRTYVKDDTLYLFWTNSGFSFRFNGTGATATVTASNQNPIYWGYLQVYVDGEFTPSQTICLNQATQQVTFAKDLPAGEHTIEVRKRNEADYGGSSTIGVKNLAVTGGSFLTAPAAPTRRIEVIGDSITSGFGNLDPTGKASGFTTQLQDGTMTYAVLAAKQLGANASIVSRSGIGFCRNTASMDSIYSYYDKTASLPNNAADNSAWDFAANPSDVVVINLGTNDGGQGVTDATMTSEAVAFLRLVREKNPNAIIIWTYGMMGDSRRAPLQAAVNTLANEGDNKVFYLPLASYVTATEGVGTHGHPAMQAEINRSTVLAKFIAEKTGWDRDATAMLQAQIQHSSQFATEENLKNYTAMSAANFKKVLENGRAVLASGKATNEELESAAGNIWQAYLSLMTAADTSKEYILIDAQENSTGVQFAEGQGSVDVDDYHEGQACVSNTGDHGTVCINRFNYNITLPEDWLNWYFEGWIYVSDPSRIPTESCLEISEQFDQLEVQWYLSQLNLKAGWNKVQLKMEQSSSSANRDQMKKLNNIRLFMVNVSSEITIKVDHFVLSRGKAAADTTAWQTAMDAAEKRLAEGENAELRKAYELASAAVSQADVDATTVRLNAALKAAESKPTAKTEIVPGKHPELVTLHGRTSTAKNGTVGLFWTNSGLSFSFKGTGATLNVSGSNTNAGARGYLNVYVDGSYEPTKTICIDRSVMTVTLAEGLTDGEHTIELRKRNEATYGGSANITIRGLTVQGEFIDPPAAPKRQIEVIGDSLTSGFGNIATDADTNYSSDTVEGTLTYAVFAAQQFGAEANIVSRSGIGFCRGTDAMDSFFGYYEKTAALPNAKLDDSDWDFAANPNDVVVINLGNNDNGAKIDGKSVSDEYMTKEAVAFLRLVREKNPNAIIIWTFGMMGDSRRAALESAVNTLVAEGDDKVFYLPMENSNAATEGMHLGHPSVQVSINRSLALAECIAEKTGWERDAHAVLQAQLQWSRDYNDETLLKDYTTVSAKAFTDAYKAGEALVADKNATNEALVAAAEAIWMTQIGLISKAEISDEYVVVSNMDSSKGWSIGGTPCGVDSKDFVEGAGCLYTTCKQSGNININTTALNIAMPSDWQNWYLECWMYVDHPENIPSGSCIELSQAIDSVEVQWGLDGLGLKAGWNKVSLRLGSGSITNGDSFKTIKNLRMFILNIKGELTFKVDNVVLSKGRVASDSVSAAFDKTLTAAQTFLSTHKNEALQQVVALAEKAMSKADMDALAPKLAAALAAAEEEGDGLWGDVNGDGKVTTADAASALQFAAELIDEDAINATVSDVNGDGKVTTADAALILQKCAELLEKFPVEND